MTTCVACGTYGLFQSGACPDCEQERCEELGIKYEEES